MLATCRAAAACAVYLSFVSALGAELEPVPRDAGDAIADESVCAIDDRGVEVCLRRPAERIVSLSPGATELLFAAGAGERIRATVSFSDYPPEARTIPRIGTDQRLDLETLLAHRPDLIVAWLSGNPGEQLAHLTRLDSFDAVIYYSEPKTFEDVASTLERLGVLAGSDAAAREAAQQFRTRIAELRARYAEASTVGVFYQVWEEPLMTVNDEHWISDVVQLCGGENLFGSLPRLVPRIDREAVLAADPEAIVVAGMGEDNDAWLDPWRELTMLRAARRGNLFFVPPSTLQRPTPRLAQGASILCEQLERARRARGR